METLVSGEVAALGRSALAIVLLTAALGKSVDLRGFSVRLRKLGVSRRYALILSSIIAGAEALVGTGMLMPRSSDVSTRVAVVLFVSFLAVSLIALARGDRSPCACFGAAGPADAPRIALGRNALLVLCGAIAVAPSAPLSGFSDWLVFFMGGATIFVLGALALTVSGLWPTMRSDTRNTAKWTKKRELHERGV
jgi:hypothetical protein